MKKSVYVLTLFLSLIFVFQVSEHCFAASTKSNIYGSYGTFEELYNAYMEAVESDDFEMQKELLQLGRSSLQAEIEMSENSARPLIDPDELYWLQQFPVYFDYGYFEERANGWTLSLGPVQRSVWSSSDKSNGWNSVYTKFRNNARWDNTDIMKEQFYCHARLVYSAVEEEWNLEPWRTSMNPITCN